MTALKMPSFPAVPHHRPPSRKKCGFFVPAFQVWGGLGALGSDRINGRGVGPTPQTDPRGPRGHVQAHVICPLSVTLVRNSHPAPVGQLQISALLTPQKQHKNQTALLPWRSAGTQGLSLRRIASRLIKTCCSLQPCRCRLAPRISQRDPGT